MKNISIILAVLVFFFSSCIRDYSTLTEFIITNNSEYNLKMRVIRFETQFYSTVDTTFIINVGSRINYEYEDNGEDAACYYPFGITSDSITIYFNDTITKEYNKTSLSQYNPLTIENYSGGKVTKGLYRYTYTFTNEDYNTATLIK